MPIKRFVKAAGAAAARLGVCAALALAGVLLTVQPGGARGGGGGGSSGSSESCIAFAGTVVCAERWGPGGIPQVVDVPGPQTEAEAAFASERERRWHARCQPMVRQDRYGVGRYYYAAEGCEFGRSED